MNGDVNAPKSPKHTRKGRVQVALLDDTVVAFDVPVRDKGHELYKKVNQHLNMVEAEYFGLLFEDEENNPCWLDPLKSMIKQVKDPTSVLFKFRVMFYTPEPNSLQEYTRYLFTLQVRRDLLDGRLKCSEDTGALLASYIVQGELGDYDSATYKDGYLAGFQFVPNQNADVEQKIVEYHQSHRGAKPADADHNMLEIARQLDMYGITLYPAKDGDGVSLDLAVYHSGILVFQNNKKMNTFSWANIRKISFKKKKFLIKLHKMVGDSNMTSFAMKSRDAAKVFWKICLNHHVFFRQNTAGTLKKQKGSFKRGSKYRYSGRTKREIQIENAEKYTTSVDPDANRTGLSPSCEPPGASAHSLSTGHHVGETSSNYYNSQMSADEEGSYSLIGGPSSSQKESLQECDQESNSSNNNRQGNFVSFNHQDITSSQERTPPPSYPQVMNGSLYTQPQHVYEEPKNTFSFEKTFNIDREAGNDEDTISLDATVHVTSTEKEIEDEVASMFKKMNESSGWQYNISSITTDELNNSDNEAVTKASEDTEVDADEKMKSQSERTEADEETEAQLKEKVKALYLQSCPTTQAYDSDSDASAMTVDDEESAFEDDSHHQPNSSTSSVTSIHRKENIHELRKYKTSGKVYHYAKEIYLTEKTYVKDLEVLTISFRSSVANALTESIKKLLFDNIDPLYDFHCSLLAELEERINNWDNSSVTEASRDSIQKIGDIMHRNMRQIKSYICNIQNHPDIVIALEAETKKSKKFEEVYKEFELSKVCYLPLNSFLLKPSQRLLYYKNMLARLRAEYVTSDPDAIDAKVAYEEVSEACKQLEKTTAVLENLHKLVGLERDLVGIEDLVHPKRLFIREGCLHKICRKGPQPRMFFLFSDLLLYTSQGVTATSQFRARAQMPLRSLKMEEGGVELHGLYAFTLTGGGSTSFVVAASSPDEKYKWMEDIQTAISKAIKKTLCGNCHTNRNEFILRVGEDNKHLCLNCRAEMEKLAAIPPHERLQYWQSVHPSPPNIKRNSTSDGGESDDEGSYSLQEYYSSLDRRHAHARTISTRRVCWHRNASISMKDYTMSLQNSVSGVLLRKYKNTNKWQKLWVVFTNFCLYFFKNYEEDAPVASLPLIGYTISKAQEKESHEEFVFKLQFKTHIYYFRTLNEYAFERWIEVISSTTKSSSARSRHNKKLLAFPT